MRPHNRFGPAMPLSVSGTSLRRDLYILLACTLSSKRFAEQTHGVDYDSLQGLRDSQEPTEISTLLLSIALRIRLFDDRGQIPKALMSKSCGSLVTGSARRKSKTPLTLREGCNKIVHTKTLQLRISFLDDFDATLPSPTSEHMEPILLLHGSKNGKSWRASLDLVKFARLILDTRVVHEA
jgi:hypothetical protein